MIEVRSCRERGDLRRFVALAERIYRDDPCWVPPLRGEELARFDRSRNPFLAHSPAEAFLARRDGEVVGRIVAIHNTRHLEAWHDGTGFFGFFECIDDQAVADALFAVAAQWLRERGLVRMRGPTNFSINEEYGLLVDGFAVPPVVMHTHHRPYYRRLLENSGFGCAQEMYAYRLTSADAALIDRLARARHLVERQGFRIRPVDLSTFDSEVERVKAIYDEAWAENWGAVRLTEAEMRELARQLRRVIDPDLTLIAEIDGRAVGCSVTLPDINQALKAAGGSLLPLGWLRLALARRRIDAVRVLIMGVLKEYRLRGVDAAMYYDTLIAGLRKGYRWADGSLINESNQPMRQAVERLGGEIYKTFRIYDRAL